MGYGNATEVSWGVNPTAVQTCPSGNARAQVHARYSSSLYTLLCMRALGKKLRLCTGKWKAGGGAACPRGTCAPHARWGFAAEKVAAAAQWPQQQKQRHHHTQLSHVPQSKLNAESNRVAAFKKKKKKPQAGHQLRNKTFSACAEEVKNQTPRPRGGRGGTCRNRTACCRPRGSALAQLPDVWPACACVVKSAKAGLREQEVRRTEMLRAERRPVVQAK
jgi:hypothetical protein